MSSKAATDAAIEAKSRADKSRYRDIVDHFIHLIDPLLEPHGYEIVHLEVHTHRQKILRLFIDRNIDSITDPKLAHAPIGIEDCTRASRILDEPLDLMPEVESAFKGAFELEVSSPGVDRPLRKPKDFVRFKGKDARIHTFRPLKNEELENPNYSKKNAKQKNFLGTLDGFESDKILLRVTENHDSPLTRVKLGKKKTKKQLADEANASGMIIRIPLVLVSKANIEPHFEFPARSLGSPGDSHENED